MYHGSLCRSPLQGYQSTYEELKLPWKMNGYMFCVSYQSTYEELKQSKSYLKVGIIYSYQSTYEELKLLCSVAYVGYRYRYQSTYEELKHSFQVIVLTDLPPICRTLSLDI